MDPVVIEQLGIAHPLARHVGDFLADLANANASAHTLRAYRGDLLQFCAHHDGETSELTAVPVRAYLAEIAELAPSTRKRKRAAVASFCRWAVRHDLLDANPLGDRLLRQGGQPCRRLGIIDAFRDAEVIAGLRIDEDRRVCMVAEKRLLRLGGADEEMERAEDQPFGNEAGRVYEIGDYPQRVGLDEALLNHCRRL